MTVKGLLQELTKEDFVSGIEYKDTKDGIMYFVTTDIKELVDFITNGITDTQYYKDGYLYTDGTKARFVKRHKWWEFKRYGEIFCRILI